MTEYRKPDSYTDADWDMVKGYMDGRDNLSPRKKTAAYMHGHRNGIADMTGAPVDRADVLRRRANMIPGITPCDELRLRIEAEACHD